MKWLFIFMLLLLPSGCVTANAFEKSASAFDKSAEALVRTASTAEQGIAGVSSRTEELLVVVRDGVSANSSAATATTAAMASATGELATLLKDIRTKTETPIPRELMWLFWLGGTTLAVVLLHSIAMHLHLRSIIRDVRRGLGLI
jgi:hypothetical protein